MLVNDSSNNALNRAEEWDLEFDAKNGFPKSPTDQLVPWTEFTQDIESNETDASDVLQNVIDDCFEEWLDLRPYMFENPEQVSIHDYFFRVLERFRIFHCRHLMVVDPSNGALRGVITRKDIFAYNGL